MTDPSGGDVAMTMREYRKGNWTVSETMILIEAKQMDDERRLRRSIGLSTAIEPPETELRWKWIEDYCWRKGCLRSQNQCNDKWDNLMRDYKKIREYERRRLEPSFHSPGAGDITGASSSSSTASYWKMEKSERKARNLPTNMLSQIYEALVEVVEKKGSPYPAVSIAGGGNGGDGGGSQIQNFPMIPEPKHQLSAPVVLPLPLTPPPQLPVLSLPRPHPQLQLPPPPPPPLPPSHARPVFPTTGDFTNPDTRESLETSPPVKRRRTTTTAEAGGSGVAAAESSSSNAVGEAISRSASVIADAIRANEERQDKRHREAVSLKERRVRMEESNAEMNRQNMNGLVEAINKLANSISALASSYHHHQQQRHNNNQHHGDIPP